ncbi:NADH:ubiquinone oxidoreductase [Rhizobium sp. LjRoot254]|uniref:NADH:ubiquinone oxidoreductase n=1 Tax=Rhizobium sp. LjRoot254 TaxID=3342297 RepID=UPI003ECC5F7E
MMMVKAGKQDDEKKVADEAASLSNLAGASAKLFAEQAAAMAVFTAYGMSVATQMTGMMLGAFRGPAEADEPTKAEAQPQTDAEAKGNVVPLRPVQETKPHAPVKAPVAKAPARKPATSKPTAGKAEAIAPKTATTKPAVKAVAASGDDLKKIPGIGPRLEKVLNDRGIARFGDISGLSKAALKKLDGELGLEGRVIRDDWAGQAKALSGGKG